jgi:Raf kinase inhibitor-like YbhB/YbcL family protein
MRKSFGKLCLLLIASLVMPSCRSEAPSNFSNSNNSNQSVTRTPEAKNSLIKVTSSAFQEGGMIPKKYTCDGANASPPLAWNNAPDGTKSFALIADDPDAPGQTWVHWVAFNLPASARELPENVPSEVSITASGRQGTTDFRKVGYGGPCPPSGAHRYYFKLYALDTELALDSSATKDQLLKAMEGHVLAEGQLMGKYQRQSNDRR